MLGTFSFEWVIAVFIGITTVHLVFLEALCGGRTIGYKGWAIQLILGIVLVVLALAVVYNSAYAATVAGIAFIVYAVEVALVPVMGSSIRAQGLTAARQFLPLFVRNVNVVSCGAVCVMRAAPLLYGRERYGEDPTGKGPTGPRNLVRPVWLRATRKDRLP